MPLRMTISYPFATLVLIAVWSIFVGMFEFAAAIRPRKAIKGEWLAWALGPLVDPVRHRHPLRPHRLSGRDHPLVAWIIGSAPLAVGIVLVVQGLRGGPSLISWPFTRHDRAGRLMSEPGRHAGAISSAFQSHFAATGGGQASQHADRAFRRDRGFDLPRRCCARRSPRRPGRLAKGTAWTRGGSSVFHALVG